MQLPARHQAVPIAGHRAYWVCCRLDTKTRSGATAAATLHPPAGDPRAHRRPDRRASSRPPTPRAIDEEVLGHERRDAGPGVRVPLLPDPRPDARGVPRGARPGDRRLGAVGAGRVVRREQADGAPLPAERCRGPARVRPGDPHARRKLAPVRVGPGQGRDPAVQPLPARRRPPGERRREHARRPEERDPGRRHRDEPPAGVRRRRPGVAGERPHARRDGDPHPLPRGHGRRLRVPLRRGLAARRPRRLPARRARTGWCASTSSRWSRPPTGS